MKKKILEQNYDFSLNEVSFISKIKPVAFNVNWSYKLSKKVWNSFCNWVLSCKLIWVLTMTAKKFGLIKPVLNCFVKIQVSYLVSKKLSKSQDLSLGANAAGFYHISYYTKE